MVERKTVMLDQNIVEAIKNIAKRYNMTMSNYLRELFREVIDVENRGLYAPALLRRTVVIKSLKRAGFAYIPIEIVRELDRSRFSVVTNRVARFIESLGIDPRDVIEELIESVPMAMVEGNKVIIPLLYTNDTLSALVDIIKSLSRALKLKVDEHQDLVVITL